MNNIRLVKLEDTERLLQIYQYYVLHTAITFEYTAPTEAEFLERIAHISHAYPYLVYCRNKEILGYAYACRYREREAFNWDVEVSVYMAPEERGQGIGSALYSRLIGILQAQGFYNAYALITYPNEGSIRLHEKFGFQKVGLCQKTGYKLGKWHDLLLMECVLKEKIGPVLPWKSIAEIKYETNII